MFSCLQKPLLSNDSFQEADHHQSAMKVMERLQDETWTCGQIVAVLNCSDHAAGVDVTSLSGPS